jgi:hypothetical protein
MLSFRNNTPKRKVWITLDTEEALRAQGSRQLTTGQVVIFNKWCYAIGNSVWVSLPACFICFNFDISLTYQSTSTLHALLRNWSFSQILWFSPTSKVKMTFSASKTSQFFSFCLSPYLSFFWVNLIPSIKVCIIFLQQILYVSHGQWGNFRITVFFSILSSLCKLHFQNRRI